MDWWTIPGPRSFIDAIIDDVREGKSVFLILPEHSPGRLSHALRETLREESNWEAVNVIPGANPVDFLYTHFVPDADPRKLRSELSLAGEEEFQRRLIWIESIPAEDWAGWSEFFLEYERVSRAVPESRRSLFLVRVTGRAKAPTPPVGVGLSSLCWDGWLRRSDMQLYSNSCIRETRSELETDLTIAVVSELGGWDPALCEYLADFKLSELIRPTELLEKFAAERSWTFQPGPYDEVTWGDGLWQTYLGKQTPHTSFGAFLLGQRFLNRLLWKAEIGILMPYIEEKRQALIEQCRAHLRLPYYSKYGVINDVYDLEIGILELLLNQSGVPSKATLEFINNLKLARNQLSHLAPVDSSILLALCRNAEEDCLGLSSYSRYAESM
jgi:uncharacterized protein (DUF2249 family)